MLRDHVFYGYEQNWLRYQRVLTNIQKLCKRNNDDKAGEARGMTQSGPKLLSDIALQIHSTVHFTCAEVLKLSKSKQPTI